MESNDLTEEQKAQARACKSGEELAALAKKEGVELSLDELEVVSGSDGVWCGSHGGCNGQEVDLPPEH